MKLNNLYILSTFLWAMTVSGCGTVQSIRLPDSGFTKDSKGVTYFLPMKLVNLKISSEPSNLEKAKAESEKLEKLFKEQSTKFKELGKGLAKKEAMLIFVSAETDAYKKLFVEIQTLKAEIAVFEPTLLELGVKAKTAKATFEAHKRNPKGCIFKLESSLTGALPNTKYKFNLMPKHSVLRDDTKTIEVSPTGLLSSTNIVATDRTGDILVQIAGSLSSLSPSIKSSNIVGKNLEEKCLKHPINLVFDPMYPNDAIATVNNKKLPIQIGRIKRIGFDQFKSEFFPSVPLKNGNSYPITKNMKDGIYYQTPAPTLIEFNYCENEDTCYPTASTVVMLPQAGPVSFIPLKSSAFVKTINDVKFDNGTLVSWTSDRPSEVLSMVGLPIEIGKALFSIPAELLSVKIDYSSKDESLTNLQQNAALRDVKNQALISCLNGVGEDYIELLSCVSALSASPE